MARALRGFPERRPLAPGPWSSRGLGTSARDVAVALRRGEPGSGVPACEELPGVFWFRLTPFTFHVPCTIIKQFMIVFVKTCTLFLEYRAGPLKAACPGLQRSSLQCVLHYLLEKQIPAGKKRPVMCCSVLVLLCVFIYTTFKKKKKTNMPQASARFSKLFIYIQIHVHIYSVYVHIFKCIYIHDFHILYNK